MWKITQVIKLYSLREVDEIIFLDISANKSSINFRLIDDLQMIICQLQLVGLKAY